MERSRFTIPSIILRFKSALTLESTKHIGRRRYLSDRECSKILGKMFMQQRSPECFTRHTIVVVLLDIIYLFYLQTQRND